MKMTIKLSLVPATEKTNHWAAFGWRTWKAVTICTACIIRNVVLDSLKHFETGRIDTASLGTKNHLHIERHWFSQPWATMCQDGKHLIILINFKLIAGSMPCCQWNTEVTIRQQGAPHPSWTCQDAGSPGCGWSLGPKCKSKIELLFHDWGWSQGSHFFGMRVVMTFNPTWNRLRLTWKLGFPRIHWHRCWASLQTGDGKWFQQLQCRWAWNSL